MTGALGGAENVARSLVGAKQADAVVRVSTPLLLKHTLQSADGREPERDLKKERDLDGRTKVAPSKCE